MLLLERNLTATHNLMKKLIPMTKNSRFHKLSCRDSKLLANIKRCVHSAFCERVQTCGYMQPLYANSTSDVCSRNAELTPQRWHPSMHAAAYPRSRQWAGVLTGHLQQLSRKLLHQCMSKPARGGLPHQDPGNTFPIHWLIKVSPGVCMGCLDVNEDEVFAGAAGW